MSTQENVQIVKDFFAAIGSYNEQDLLALAAATRQGDETDVRIPVPTGKDGSS